MLAKMPDNGYATREVIATQVIQGAKKCMELRCDDDLDRVNVK